MLSTYSNTNENCLHQSEVLLHCCKSCNLIILFLPLPSTYVDFPFLYAVLLYFQCENGVGDGSSLIHPPVEVDMIRHLYPEDIKDYGPGSKKVGKMNYKTNQSKRAPFTLCACI